MRLEELAKTSKRAPQKTEEGKENAAVAPRFITGQPALKVPCIAMYVLARFQREHLYRCCWSAFGGPGMEDSAPASLVAAPEKRSAIKGYEYSLLCWLRLNPAALLATGPLSRPANS